MLFYAACGQNALDRAAATLGECCLRRQLRAHIFFRLCFRLFRKITDRRLLVGRKSDKLHTATQLVVMPNPRSRA